MYSTWNVNFQKRKLLRCCVVKGDNSPLDISNVDYCPLSQGTCTLSTTAALQYPFQNHLHRGILYISKYSDGTLSRMDTCINCCLWTLGTCTLSTASALSCTLQSQCVSPISLIVVVCEVCLEWLWACAHPAQPRLFHLSFRWFPTTKNIATNRILYLYVTLLSLHTSCIIPNIT